MKQRSAIIRLFPLLLPFLALLAGCTLSETIGSVTGTVDSGDGQTGAFQINFTALNYEQADANSLSLTLSNANNDALIFVLAAKNAGSSSFGSKFPTGDYSFLDASLLSVQGELTVAGTSQQSVSASTGSLTLQALDVSDSAITRIAATFNVSEASLMSMWGDFDVTFDAS